jgi:hypothetical protein
VKAGGFGLCGLAGHVPAGNRTYASGENSQFLHKLAHLLRCDILVTEEDDASLGDCSVSLVNTKDKGYRVRTGDSEIANQAVALWG